jgi:uncharacterized membrane-anchored protein
MRMWGGNAGKQARDEKKCLEKMQAKILEKQKLTLICRHMREFTYPFAVSWSKVF